MISQFEYRQMAERLEARRTKPLEQLPCEAVAVADGHEADLHEAILDECERRGWLPFHGSMAHRSHRTFGEPDFIILLDAGRLLMVECKTKSTKPTIEQRGKIAWAAKLGHTIHVVRSFAEFLDFTTRPPK